MPHAPSQTHWSHRTTPHPDRRSHDVHRHATSPPRRSHAADCAAKPLTVATSSFATSALNPIHIQHAHAHAHTLELACTALGANSKLVNVLAALGALAALFLLSEELALAHTAL